MTDVSFIEFVCDVLKDCGEIDSKKCLENTAFILIKSPVFLCVIIKFL